MEFSAAVLFIGLIVFFAHFFAATFNRTKIPDVLPLVLTGIIAGPVLNFINPEIFGRFGEIFSTLTLVVILFEAGLCLDISAVKSSAGRGAVFALLTFIFTLVFVAALSHVFLGLGLLQAAVFGGILAGAAPSIVIPMLRKMSVSRNIISAVVFETTISEVLSIIFVLQIIPASEGAGFNPAYITGRTLLAIAAAAAAGSAAALFWSMMLNKVRLLENSAFTTPAFVFIVFGGAELAGFSGAIAALCFGIVLGNVKDINIGPVKHLNVTLNGTEKSFMAEVVFLMRTFFFLYIGISMKPAGFDTVIFSAVLTAVILAARVISANMSFNKEESRFDITAAGVMVSRGLASAVLAGMPAQAGMEGGEIIRDTVFAVILFSILVNSFLSYSVERKKAFYKFVSAFFRRFSGAPPEPPGDKNIE
ncbi:MAG TPA: cation:proton antiporter [Candidatus Goldiibacteriota bacterium]|nr:cation:proton antiporter [Candidatus Goldiibacteriota bacterium]HPI03786.1 cation:proton antiporter [Candidatus Goldiibacteriota bacterium]HRQ43252.1 cation:proton antiporter [Candidatus Goldiibacteriota bacterium]